MPLAVLGFIEEDDVILLRAMVHATGVFSLGSSVLVRTKKTFLARDGGDHDA